MVVSNMSSKNKNLKNENMTYEERIDSMKENMGLKFVEKAKNILKDGKVIKGENAKENFNTELNELTFEVEELYPLTYEEFKKEFPKTIELVETVKGSIVTDSVKKGLVLQGWSLETNVNEIIKRINKNVKDSKKAEEAINLRKEVLKETIRMKNEFEMEWCADLFWKCWKIKEGEKRFDYLKNYKGEKVAEKRIKTIKDIGGLEFLKVLQEEIYGE